MRIKHISKNERILLIAIFLLVLSLIGGSMNDLARKTNNCKMPVLSNNSALIDDEHSIFQDKSKVNYYFLTDILFVNFGKSLGQMSIGDVILTICYIGFAYFTGSFVINKIKRK